VALTSPAVDARILVTILRTVFALLSLYAIGRQLGIHAQLGLSLTNFCSYFTNLANAFAAGTFLAGAWIWRGPAPTKSIDVLRAMAVINMTVVGALFSVLLRNVELGSLLPWVNFVLHYLMPVVVILDWIVLPPRARLGVKDLLLCPIFPAIYLSYILIRGNIVGWYPYPFLNPANVGGYGGVALYAVGVTATFVIGGWVLIALGNGRRGAIPFAAE
jgi:hypothetical protein